MKRDRKLAAPKAAPTLPEKATVLPMWGLCPQDEKLTEYDVRNMPLYTWLLIAEEDGANIEELASDVLHFDLSENPGWAIRVTRSYLQRARWVHDHLYPWID